MWWQPYHSKPCHEYPSASPSDFNEFWNKTKAEAARFPLTYTKEYVEKYSTDKIDCYLIRLQLNKQNQCIYGYLFYPKAEGKYPVVLCPPGAGIKTIKGPMRHKYYAEEDVLVIFGCQPGLAFKFFYPVIHTFQFIGGIGYGLTGFQS